MEKQKHGDRYELELFYNDKPKGKREKAYRWYVIDKDKKKFAQFLIDMYLEGFPIIEAYEIAVSKIKDKDWILY